MKSTRLITSAIILLLLAFSFCYGEEAAKKTAMEVYLALPDEPNEAQVAEFYTELKAESKVADPATCDENNKPFNFLMFASIPTSFIETEIADKFEGENRGEAPFYDFIYHPTQKALLLKPLALRILVETEVEGNLNLQLARLEFLSNCHLTSIREPIVWYMKHPYVTEKTREYYSQVTSQLEKYNPHSKLYALADKNSVEPQLKGKDKWDHLAYLKVQIVKKENISICESVGYWKWLEKNFTDEDIFCEEVAEDVFNTRVVSPAALARDYFNLEFYDEKLLYTLPHEEKAGEHLALAYACYRLALKLGDFDKLETKGKNFFTHLTLYGKSKALRLRTPQIHKAEIHLAALDCKYNEMKKDYYGTERYDLILLEKGTATGVAFAGKLKLEGKGEKSNFDDCIYPQFHLRYLEDDKTGRSQGQCKMVTQGYGHLAVLLASSDYYDWNLGGNYYGFKQPIENLPKVHVPLTLNFDVTEEGLKALVTPENVQRFREKAIGATTDPEEFLKLYVPIVTYTVDKADYFIYKVKYTSLITTEMVYEQDRAFSVVVFAPAADAKVTKVEVGMIRYYRNNWYGAGTFRSEWQSPYYVYETAKDENNVQIFATADYYSREALNAQLEEQKQQGR